MAQPPLTVEEAALAIDRSVPTIWRYLKRGLLVGRRLLGRTVIDAAEIKRFVRCQRDET